MSIWILAPLLLVAALVARSVVIGYRSPAQLQAIAEAVRGDAALIDVRTPAEFAGAHLRRARNLPLDQLSARIGSLSKKKPVVLYCHSGSRSSRAASALRAAGFKNVFDLGPLKNGVRIGLG